MQSKYIHFLNKIKLWDQKLDRGSDKLPDSIKTQ